jgi:hypothetical protein
MQFMIKVSTLGAMFRQSIKTKDHKSNTPIQVLMFLCFIRLSENGTLVPKHVEVTLTINCILLYFIVCICCLMY